MCAVPLFALGYQSHAFSRYNLFNLGAFILPSLAMACLSHSLIQGLVDATQVLATIFHLISAIGLIDEALWVVYWINAPIQAQAEYLKKEVEI